MTRQKSEIRGELLRLLREYADGEGALSEEGAHRRAEEVLLEYVEDVEITRAWKDAADLWWYA